MQNFCLKKRVLEINSFVLNALRHMTVIGRSFVFVVIIPVANQVRFGIIFVREIMIRITVDDRIAIWIVDQE